MGERWPLELPLRCDGVESWCEVEANPLDRLMMKLIIFFFLCFCLFFWR